MEQIYFNGKIITMEEETMANAIKKMPEAILIKDGIIKLAGTLEEVKSAASFEAIMVDLKDRCLMPSFIDAHSHIVMNGKMAACCFLGDCDSYDSLVIKLKSYILEKNVGQDEVVIGFGYDHNFLNEARQPDKRVLDQVSLEIPIMIIHVSAHMACVNSKALELAEINESTMNPQGGVIGRIENSKEPSGYLEETAMTFVQAVLLERIQLDENSIIAGMQKDYIENGITTVQEGAATAKELELLSAISASGQLLVDVVAYPLMMANGEYLMRKYVHLQKKYVNHLKIGGYKLVLDGSPQGRSAWMSQPYLAGEKDYCGYPWLTDREVEEYVQTAIKEGQQLLAHCNGDAASEQYLNAYQKSLEIVKTTEELRPVMIHCQTVRNDQLERMAKINMIASIFVGHVWYWGDVHKKNFGEERGGHISPVKDAIDRGVLVNFHQDTPVTKPNMLYSIWCAVNRISRSGSIIGKEQRIDVYEAMKAVTINAAYGYFEEDSKGTLSAGKRADMVILDQSPLETAEKDIKNIRVIRTIKDGQVIFDREK